MISQLEDGHFPETCKDHHLEGEKGRHNAWLQELNNTFETFGGHQQIEFCVMPSMHSQFTVRKSLIDSMSSMCLANVILLVQLAASERSIPSFPQPFPDDIMLQIAKSMTDASLATLLIASRRYYALAQRELYRFVEIKSFLHCVEFAVCLLRHMASRKTRAAKPDLGGRVEDYVKGISLDLSGITWDMADRLRDWVMIQPLFQRLNTLTIFLSDMNHHLMVRRMPVDIASHMPPSVKMVTLYVCRCSCLCCWSC